MALDTSKAEYIALTHAAQDGLYLRQLQVEMCVDIEGLGVLLLYDNQSSMKIS